MNSVGAKLPETFTLSLVLPFAGLLHDLGVEHATRLTNLRARWSSTSMRAPLTTSGCTSSLFRTTAPPCWRHRTTVLTRQPLPFCTRRPTHETPATESRRHHLWEVVAASPATTRATSARPQHRETPRCRGPRKGASTRGQTIATVLRVAALAVRTTGTLWSRPRTPCEPCYTCQLRLRKDMARCRLTVVVTAALQWARPNLKVAVMREANLGRRKCPAVPQPVRLSPGVGR